MVWPGLPGASRLEWAVFAGAILFLAAALVWAILFGPRTFTAEEACLRYVPPGTPEDLPRCPGSLSVYESTLQEALEPLIGSRDPLVVDAFCRVLELVSGSPVCAQGPGAVLGALEGFTVEVREVGGGVLVSMVGPAPYPGSRILLVLVDPAGARGAAALECEGEYLRSYRPGGYIGGPLPVGEGYIPFFGVVEDGSSYDDDVVRLLFKPQDGSPVAAFADIVYDGAWECIVAYDGGEAIIGDGAG